MPVPKEVRERCKQPTPFVFTQNEYEEVEEQYDADTLMFQHLAAQVDALETAKNQAYSERNQCVALAARLALAVGWNTGLGRHVGDPWEDDWRNIVFIDLPAGQVSWHIHDSELYLFAFLPPYKGKWDGHTTEEKYGRLKVPFDAFGRALRRLIAGAIDWYLYSAAGEDLRAVRLEKLVGAFRVARSKDALKAPRRSHINPSGCPFEVEIHLPAEDFEVGARTIAEED